MINRTWMLMILMLLPASVRAQTPDSSRAHEAARLSHEAARLSHEAAQSSHDSARLAHEARKALIEERVRQVSEVLRARVRQRFAQRVTEELRLTQEQAAELESSAQKFAAEQEELATRMARLNAELRLQLRPQVEAVSDSIAKLTDELVELQLKRAQLRQQEARRLSEFLTPVQRARYLAMQRALMRRFIARGGSAEEFCARIAPVFRRKYGALMECEGLADAA